MGATGPDSVTLKNLELVLTLLRPLFHHQLSELPFITVLPRSIRLGTLQSRVRTLRRGSRRARIASGMAPIEAHGYFRSRTRLLVYS